MTKRKHIPQSVRQAALIEAGYRCAVPTCRTILAIDLHHIVEVSEGGGNDISNLLALCPTCHALFHRNVITLEAINFKGVIISKGSDSIEYNFNSKGSIQRGQTRLNTI